MVLRGKALCEKIKSLPTKSERENFALTLSKHAIEDVVSEYQWHERLSEIDEYIRTL